MRYSKLFSGIITVAVLSIFSMQPALAQMDAQEQDNGDVVEVLKDSDNHTIFAGLLEDTELEGLLKEEGPYTVLAPTDDAFEAMGEDFEQLKQDPEQLQNVVIGHLYNGEIRSDDVETAKSVEITEGDIEATNGVVHVMEEVLVE